MPVERVVIVVALVLAIALAVWLTRRVTAARFTRLRQTIPDWQALGHEPDGRRTLIAFSTPSCAACHKAQAPAIDLAQQQLGHETFRVIKIDASRRPEAARAFGILTVPATVVLAADGDQVVALNHGFAPSTQLIRQLQQA
jgi:thiol-disulfide isomerase/thioredoxin